jgi:hypothetical protein
MTARSDRWDERQVGRLGAAGRGYVMTIGTMSIGLVCRSIGHMAIACLVVGVSCKGWVGRSIG